MSKAEMAQDFWDDVWTALVKWKRAREKFQAHADYDTTHAYCAAVEELEKLVVAHEAELEQELFLAWCQR